MSGADERLLRLLQDARLKIESERKRRTESIAIVGMGCRLPGGVSDPSTFWQLLVEGVDATREVPADRWDMALVYDPDPEAPGKCYVARGGFLDQIDGFDAEFFGISPREAIGLDPQQRLLLEVAWEALENAGIPPDTLGGTATGVWVGLCLDDYARRSLTSGQLERIEAYTALGNARSLAAGRIAYVLGVHGPVMQLDTSCSSSLVAIHLACQSLRAGECDLALVGGVNLMSSPEATIALCKLRALSPDGRCKTFDAKADGYGRGEGCGVVVLERLTDAQRRGERIHALIRGSAINHDGRSNGLTAPSGAAQERVIRAALVNAGVAASTVGYVEVHGTGTQLGDPIEVLALSRAYQSERSLDAPVYMGSVKTNFGHLEGAAGVAGLMKTALCLAHGYIAPHLHYNQPNPNVPWAALPVRVPRETTSWPHYGETDLAGVSSFGISGTNAHVVLERAREPPRPEPVGARSAELIVLSARSEAALRAAAIRLGEHLERGRDMALIDVAYSLVTTRSAMEVRAALAVPTVRSLCNALASSQIAEMLTVGSHRSVGSPPKVVFVFPGQGSQWLGMGRQLLAEEPAFRQALTECDSAIFAEAGWSVLAELRASAETSRLEQIDVVQPVLFAVALALTALWRSWGVEPDLVVGHSMGEVAAACVSGALSLEDAVTIVCRRSALLRRISGQGEMALVDLPIAEAEAALDGFEDQLAVAVSNSKHATVLSGDPGALADVLGTLEARGVFCRRVKVDVASHSPQVDPLLDELVTTLGAIAPRAARIPMRSTVTGAGLAGDELTAAYWADNLRRPVRFAATIEALVAEGFTLFVEVSPHPLLVSAMQAIRDEARAVGVAVGSLRREQGERLTLLESLGALYTHGQPLDPTRLFSGAGQRVELPTYPWQRQRFWLERPVDQAGETTHERSFLGARIPAAGRDAVYQSLLSGRAPSWLSAHRVAGQVVVPGAGLAELMRAAAQEQRGVAALIEVRDLVLRVPLRVGDEGACRVQVVLTERGTQVAVYSQPAALSSAHEWTLHATAAVEDASTGPTTPFDLAAARERCREATDVAAVYASLAGRGLDHGPRFQGLRALWRGHDEVLAEVVLAEGLDPLGYGVHPALLDAALQALAGLEGAEPAEGALLPFQIARFAVIKQGVSSAIVHARLMQPRTAANLVADVALVDASGELLALMQGIHLRRAEVIEHPRPTIAEALFRLDWQKAPMRAHVPTVTGRWAVVRLGDEIQDAWAAEQLARAGASYERVGVGGLRDIAADHVVCVWGPSRDPQSAIGAAQQGLEVVQSLSGHENPPRLWWITRGAAAVNERDEVAPACSTVWGLGRTVMHEHPELRCKLLDIDGATSRAELWAYEMAAEHEAQVAWRDGERYVARLIRAPAPGPEAGEALRVSGTVLVTGGVGALGLEIARALAKRGVRHLVLIGRRGKATPGIAEAIAELERLGAQVTVAAVDVTDGEALRRLLEAVTVEWPLRGVVHAAGVLDDGVLSEQTAVRFARVMMPKVMGAWNLHTLTLRADLDIFVLFSSIAGTFGSAGQGGYAAANTFLDALAAHRQALGLPGSSLAWGPWAERGLAATAEPSQQDRMARQGVRMITMSEGRALVDQLIGQSEAQLVVALIDVARLLKAHHTATPSLFRALAAPSTQPTAPEAPAVTKRDWPNELAGLSVLHRVEAVTDLVRLEVARVLSFGSGGSVPLGRQLKDLGFDSLMAVELRNALARRTSMTLPGTLVFHHPTVEAIARYMIARWNERGVLSNDQDGQVAYGENLRRLANPKARVFCFHDAGGSAAMFTRFCEIDVHGVEVHAISHARSSAPSEASAARYLSDAVAYIERFSDVPYLVFGHSLGGFFAWRVVQELGCKDAALPATLALSATGFGQALGSGFADHDLAKAFALVVGERADTTDHIRGDFYADVRLWRAMPARIAEPLNVPIAAFLGREDQIATESAMRAWSTLTTRDFSLTIIPGGHFYLFDDLPRRSILHDMLRLLGLDG